VIQGDGKSAVHGPARLQLHGRSDAERRRGGHAAGGGERVRQAPPPPLASRLHRESKYLQQMDVAVPETARLLLLQVGGRASSVACGLGFTAHPSKKKRGSTPAVHTDQNPEPSETTHTNTHAHPHPLHARHAPPTNPQEDKFKFYFSQLSHVVRAYEAVLAQIPPVFKPLLRPHLEDVEHKVAPGMFNLSWTSMNIDGYLHRFKQVRRRALCWGVGLGQAGAGGGHSCDGRAHAQPQQQRLSVC